MKSMKSNTPMKKLKPVPYVRHSGVQTKFRKERVHFGVLVQGFLSMRLQPLFRQLQKDGILPEWKGKACPHCGTGRLQSLRFFKDGKVWARKCAAKHCRKYIQPHDFHPVFQNGSGASYTSLGHQAAALCCALAGVPVTATPVI